MSQIVIVYFSGYGHTKVQAEAVAVGAQSVAETEVKPFAISENGDWDDGLFGAVETANAVIYGSPTFMGGPAWQFKKFADASSKPWSEQKWADKLAGGFTNSASVNGDKFSTMTYFFTLSQQHSQIWVSLGLLPANTKSHGPDDANWTAGFAGAYAISPADVGPSEAPRKGDLESARHLGARIAKMPASRHAG